MTEKKYGEDRLKPPVWDPNKHNYNDWRLLVVMWCTASERAKLAKARQRLRIDPNTKRYRKGQYW